MAIRPFSSQSGKYNQTGTNQHIYVRTKIDIHSTNAQTQSAKYKCFLAAKYYKLSHTNRQVKELAVWISEMLA